jgi:triacylglycerol lipase
MNIPYGPSSTLIPTDPSQSAVVRLPLAAGTDPSTSAVETGVRTIISIECSIESSPTSQNLPGVLHCVNMLIPKGTVRMLSNRIFTRFAIGCVAFVLAASMMVNSSEAATRSVAVLVSGGTTQAPFTTPTEACRSGKPAGPNFTALRQALLNAGIDTYTVPAMNGPGPAHSTAFFDAFKFGDCPEILPPSVTINTNQALDQAGPKLVAFLDLLRSRYGVSKVSLIGWSYGGQVSREAIRLLRMQRSPIQVTSLITIGSPWTGMYPNNIVMGEESISVCQLQPTCVATAVGASIESDANLKDGVVGQLTTKRMMAWNANQVGVLDNVPVTAIAGDAVQLAGGSPAAWPNDALVQVSSALASDVPQAVVPNITRLTFPDVHSATMAWQWRLVLGKQVSLTEDPAVLAAVVSAVRAGH